MRISSIRWKTNARVSMSLLRTVPRMYTSSGMMFSAPRPACTVASDDRHLPGLTSPADDVLQVVDHQGCHRHGVDTEVGLGSMAAFSEDADVNLIIRRGDIAVFD